MRPLALAALLLLSACQTYTLRQTWFDERCQNGLCAVEVKGIKSRADCRKAMAYLNKQQQESNTMITCTPEK